MNRPILLADVGNSRVKWALWRNGNLYPGTPFASESHGLAARLDRHWAGLEVPEAVYASNVAGPSVDACLSQWTGRGWGLRVNFARTEAAGGGVINGYQRPECLGVDRWLGLLGLRRHYTLPGCVADCGTALTIDFLDVLGRHQGGLIAPGLRAMHSVLASNAHHLVRVPESPATAPTLARDTMGGIQSGCLLACVGLIEKVVADLRHGTHERFSLVMTGGDAALIGQALGCAYRLDEHLVLRGLSSLAR